MTNTAAAPTTPARISYAHPRRSAPITTRVVLTDAMTVVLSPTGHARVVARTR